MTSVATPSLRTLRLDDGFAEIVFDRDGAPVNTLGQPTLAELDRALKGLAADPTVRGLLLTSAKDGFIAGADIGEFTAMFDQSDAQREAVSGTSNQVFTRLETLPFPTVAAIHGFALGGGLELALAADFRIGSTKAVVGFPEVKLGIIPGYGGSVRMPRVAGMATAIQWIAKGEQYRAYAAIAAGVLDEVVAPESLRAAALSWLTRAAAGELDRPSRRARKLAPAPAASEAEQASIAQLASQLSRPAARHQPAALAALKLIEQSASLDRDAALQAEQKAFASIAGTQTARALTQIFLNDQTVKRLARQYAQAGQRPARAAVLGAGIMGGGIAYTSALNGTPVRMIDISAAQLELGMKEANKLVDRQLALGRFDAERGRALIASITPQLDHDGVEEVDLVVEAVVENLGIKRAVLEKLQQRLKPDAVVATNTSSLRVDDIASALARPEQLVGMHFFNPVPAMPLVEIIRGEQSSQAAVASAVAYALEMRKTPIVVKDCPGFLVNRVLTAYVRGFLQLLTDGADFREIDRVMEAFGWPMGPAWLEDVIGMDTGAHALDIISAGYPDRMPPLTEDALHLMAARKRLGQKSGAGFYRWEPDPKGRLQKLADPDALALVAETQADGARAFTDEEIVERMMLPMVVEAAWSLQEGVAQSAAELDTAMLLGVGFPAHLGGPLKYADALGLDTVSARCAHYRSLGGQFEVPADLRLRAEQRRPYHG